jgi:cysteine desulfurase family protein (TIGR01976 family)
MNRAVAVPQTHSVFPMDWVRSQFPAVQQASPFAFMDNGAGAQAPQRVLQVVADHLLHRNVQRGGRYKQSVEVDESIAKARESVALFLNAESADEVAFGMNATSLIRLVGLGIAYSFPADRREIVVTDLDHEANIATWIALEREGAKIVWWRMRDDGRLHVDDLKPLLSSRTRAVACTYASNAIGTIVDIRAAANAVHDVGAELFVDAVHYGPHGPFDVQELGCDYLVCSGYKIFAPHMGFMWGKRTALEKLPSFREAFIPDKPPDKFEIGTFVYENVAGMDAAIHYIEELGKMMGGSSSRRGAIAAGMNAIREHEAELSSEFLVRAKGIKGFRVYGISSADEAFSRTPTFCFNLDGFSAADLCQRLIGDDLGVRDGHMYSPRLMSRLGTESGVRASLVHYNTVEEVGRLCNALEELSSRHSTTE